MKRKIFASVLAVVCAAVLLSAGLIAYGIYDASARRTDALNRADALALAGAMEQGADVETHLALAAKGGVRVTVVAADGGVLADNAASPDAMENHLAREEFQAAAASGEGKARRSSSTLGEQYAYYAVRLSDGRLVRVARPQRTVLGLLSDMRGVFVAVVLAVLALSVWLSFRVARAVVKPLLALDLDHPEENVVYEELTPLLTRMAAQNGRLNEQLREMSLRKNQLSEITRGMREGLVVLDGDERAVSVNESAIKLLGVTLSPCEGRHLYELNRDARLVALMKAAEEGGEAEGLLLRGERAMELRVSSVTGEDGARQGYVLLIVDVTERRSEEKTRREFSANVSHELKTPLTSISGYAEIMFSGVAREEDMRAFAGRIYAESQRLIALIGDIMRLSRLDEGDEKLAFERVNLRELAGEVCSTLTDAAERRGVRLTVEGAGADLLSVRPLAREMLYNLVDNAIRYNVEGGSVTVRLRGETVIVEDTGVGIAPEHQEKVFQRFYRVDKSHSKATGGTGLGLSIVKHAAQTLGARVSLESEVGKGTRVTVFFAPGKAASAVEQPV